MRDVRLRAASEYELSEHLFVVSTSSDEVVRQENCDFNQAGINTLLASPYICLKKQKPVFFLHFLK